MPVVTGCAETRADALAHSGCVPGIAERGEDAWLGAAAAIAPAHSAAAAAAVPTALSRLLTDGMYGPFGRPEGV